MTLTRKIKKLRWALQKILLKKLRFSVRCVVWDTIRIRIGIKTMHAGIHNGYFQEIGTGSFFISNYEQLKIYSSHLNWAGETRLIRSAVLNWRPGHSNLPQSKPK
jgi:hypothetical protein